MMVKRLVAVGCALGLGLTVGACTSVSDVVSDHWPHFAGGEPNGVPPRPGDPGYDAFIAHGQPQQNPAFPAGGAQPGTAAPTAALANPNPGGASQSPAAYTEPPPNRQPGTQLPPAAAAPVSDPGGGLY